MKLLKQVRAKHGGNQGVVVGFIGKKSKIFALNT